MLSQRSFRKVILVLLHFSNIHSVWTERIITGIDIAKSKFMSWIRITQCILEGILIQLIDKYLQNLKTFLYQINIWIRGAWRTLKGIPYYSDQGTYDADETSTNEFCEWKNVLSRDNLLGRFLFFAYISIYMDLVYGHLAKVSLVMRTAFNPFCRAS
jgi:hypothetical protein